MKGAFDKEPPEQGPLLEQLEQLQECEERALREKEATGRYTIARAAKIFVRNEPGFNESELCIRLTNAAREGELPRYASGTNARLRRPLVRDFLDEVLRKDLNAWLNKHEPETTYRFLKPASQIVGAGEAAKPEWVKRAREMGEAWMLAEEKRAGKLTTVERIARHLEGELSTQGITGARGKFLDWETIKREALTGITGRKRGDNFRNMKGNPHRKKKSPIVQAQ